MSIDEKVLSHINTCVENHNHPANRSHILNKGEKSRVAITLQGLKPIELPEYYKEIVESYKTKVKQQQKRKIERQYRNHNLNEARSFSKNFIAAKSIKKSECVGLPKAHINELVSKRSFCSYSRNLLMEEEENPLLSEYSPQRLQQISSEACLLYTSPSPRDLSTSRMPSSA
eukprot:TRINITY_DN66406_c0_g1_i2.p1 TRINITY_DN66406_c0_g1~~TRINITY_DN66406_c0_g1_i2.p1  ORF type:complete len:197 (-),score=25.28 TRINITY_DN66406_c0_g1_i2:66-581(-)